MNNISLIGRLTANPELKNTQNGNSVTSFTLAVERAFSSKDQERQTDFINCVAWRQTAEFVAKYFSKGIRIALTGSLQSRQFTDKEGNKRTAFEVVADHVFFADGKSAATSNQQPAQPTFAAQNNDFEEIVGDEDLPF